MFDRGLDRANDVTSLMMASWSGRDNAHSPLSGSNNRRQPQYGSGNGDSQHIGHYQYELGSTKRRQPQSGSAALITSSPLGVVAREF